MRNVMLLSARLVLGGYLSVHGAQKLFGVLGGHGLEATGQGGSGWAAPSHALSPWPPSELGPCSRLFPWRSW